MQSVPKSQVAQVRYLYKEKKLSAREIAETLGYSIDAIYYIMRKNRIQRRSSKENNLIHFHKKPATFCIKNKLSSADHKLLVAGVMLYWAEGYKTSKSKGIDFANSDPAMQTLFIHFLRTICNVDESKFRVHLYSHSQSATAKQIAYWSTILDIPKRQFTKPYINPNSTLDKKDKMPYGLVHIRYFDKKLLQQVLSWIEEYKTQLIL
jgi:hypothetical protein